MEGKARPSRLNLCFQPLHELRDLVTQSRHSLPTHHFRIDDRRDAMHRFLQVVVHHHILVQIDELQLLQRRLKPLCQLLLRLALTLSAATATRPPMVAG